MNLSELRMPTTEEEVEWRVQKGGINKSGKPWAIIVPYVQNRAIQNKLDNVCGSENWKNEFTNAPDGGVLCGISIFLPVGPNFEWVTKWDGAPNTDIESVKGGLSNAMKRAAVQWGIGRDLYTAKGTIWAEFSDNGKHECFIKKKEYAFNAPILNTILTISEDPFFTEMKGFAVKKPDIYKSVLSSWNKKSAREITSVSDKKAIVTELKKAIQEQAA